MALGGSSALSNIKRVRLQKTKTNVTKWAFGEASEAETNVTKWAFGEALDAETNVTKWAFGKACPT